ncbi:MAG: hypothetical protein COU82_00915 [Candidatus Portnoybacteria bacterium CG10_big_fil_rev_8_21_14_0_10_38_18]|uniref:Glycosyltransferase 2-like domain-containing protein n=1 Tax=Candidatus Portnoybacteria bacterium CG10_big_fil_rev_8_21_14_0_10_38_18 TaxID=1974813 RepID=A0A2M8KCI1_9BACT|nr:MAG: hypothetical protein COU82_00915 [Candidatus Portnoybacteria bacterium CG10_big_fil_rev_8_21_14_0_10_38_18]
MEVIFIFISILNSIFVFYFALYFFYTLKIYLLAEESSKGPDKVPSKDISVVVPAHNVESVIEKSIQSVLDQENVRIPKIVIVDDNSNASTKNNIRKVKTWDKRIGIIKLSDGKPSKAKALLIGIKRTSTEFVALLDADTILDKKAISRTFNYLLDKKKSYATCLIDPVKQKGIIYQLICYDRLFRQRILQVVRNYFSCSNLPGCFGIFNKRTFIKTLENGFLEDLISTYRISTKGDEVLLLKQVLAYEHERTNLKTLIFQRIRWTIGNIHTSPFFYRTLLKVGFVKKVIFFSYPLLWYIIHYWLVFLLVMSVVYPSLISKYLIMAIGYSGLVLLSSVVIKEKIYGNPISFLLHIVVFPFCVVIALFMALYTLAEKRSFFFTKESLFARS